MSIAGIVGAITFCTYYVMFSVQRDQVITWSM